MRSRRWCFTINNPTQEDVDKIERFHRETGFQYCVFGIEEGASGTRHYQGFLILSAPQRLGYLRREFNDRAHYEQARGTSLQAANYCKKDGNFQELGQLPQQQGKRTDIDAFKEWAKAQEETPSERAIANEFPALYLRYGPERVVSMVAHLRPQPQLLEGEPEFRQWQRVLHGQLEQRPDERTIQFLIDPVGGKGKTWFVKYMVTRKPDQVQFLSIGKRDDLAYAIDTSKSIFLFDIPRGGMELLQYSVLEKLKDQMVFSAKYHSAPKILPNKVHVCVFGNEMPDSQALTNDRYKITELSRAR